MQPHDELVQEVRRLSEAQAKLVLDLVRELARTGVRPDAGEAASSAPGSRAEAPTGASFRGVVQGSAPSFEEIQDARRNAWRGFPRELP